MAFAAAGTSALQSLKSDAGARAAGMGGAFTAIADNPSALFWNPAGIDNIDQHTASFMHTSGLEGITYDGAAYVAPLANMHVGAAIQHVSYGSMDELDSVGVRTGSFSPVDDVVMISAARTFGMFQAGAAVKYISSKITATATAYAADAGVLMPLLNRRVHLGLSIQNVGTQVTYIQESASLPMIVRGGVSARVLPSLLLALDGAKANDSDLRLSAGVEYTRALGIVTVANRVGYTDAAKDTGGTNGFTLGAGVDVNGYVIDYAFVPYGKLGATHRVELSLRFGPSAGKTAN